MKQIIQLGDKTQSVYREDELKIATALGNDCQFWFEAGVDLINSNSALFNRANGVYIPATVKNTPYILNTNTPPMFTVTAPSSEYDLGSVNDEFSFICVIKPKSGVLNRLFGYPESYTSSNGAHSPHLFIGATNRRIEYNSKGISNIIASKILTEAEMGEVAIYTVTFSTEKGVYIYRNGALIASNTTFNIPLDYKGVNIRNSLNADLGHYLVASIDLSKDENLAKLKLIHDALKKRYSIT